jgi:hypothetical protein
VVCLTTVRNGFTALLGGGNIGGYYRKGVRGCWWSAIADAALNHYIRSLQYDLDYLAPDLGGADWGLSVRLLMD